MMTSPLWAEAVGTSPTRQPRASEVITIKRPSFMNRIKPSLTGRWSLDHLATSPIEFPGPGALPRRRRSAVASGRRWSETASAAHAVGDGIFQHLHDGLRVADLHDDLIVPLADQIDDHGPARIVHVPEDPLVVFVESARDDDTRNVGPGRAHALP